MKKLFVILAAVVLTVSASAQEKEVVTAHKTFDNWYLGINAGAATPMQKWGDAGFMKGFAPSVGLRLGKNLTTVVGVAIDANAYFESDEKSLMKTRTFFNAINIDGVGTFNLSNFFGGYLGKPRLVEFIALGGFGWTHQFGSYNCLRANGINSKAALDLTFNLGSSRAVQLYLEPALVFGLWDNGRMFNALSHHTINFGYDSRSGLFQLNVGLNYKFGTSNGTKNFAFARLRDQGEIDDLNARINELRDESDSKDRRIARDIRRIAALEDSLEAAKKVKQCAPHQQRQPSGFRCRETSFSLPQRSAQKTLWPWCNLRRKSDAGKTEGSTCSYHYILHNNWQYQEKSSAYRPSLSYLFPFQRP